MKIKKSGFTLIEVMLVISLIGILTVALATQGNFAVTKSTKTSTLVDIAVYQVSIESVIRLSDTTPSSMADLLYLLNSDLDSQFKLDNKGDWLESISRTNKDGDSYKIYTSDFVHYKIECGEYGKELWVTKDGGVYEERVYDN